MFEVISGPRTSMSENSSGKTLIFENSHREEFPWVNIVRKTSHTKNFVGELQSPKMLMSKGVTVFPSFPHEVKQIISGSCCFCSIPTR